MFSFTLLLLLLNIECSNKENIQNKYKGKEYSFDNLDQFIDTYFYSYKRFPISVEEILEFEKKTQNYYKTDYKKLNDYFDWSLHQLVKYKDLIKMETIDSIYTVRVNHLDCILYQAKISNRCTYSEKEFDMQWLTLSSPVFHFDNFSAYRGKYYHTFRESLNSVIKKYVKRIILSPKNNTFLTYRINHGINTDCKNTSISKFSVEYLNEVEELCYEFFRINNINGISFLLPNNK